MFKIGKLEEGKPVPGRWEMEVNIFGPQSLPWGSTATAQVWVGDELLLLPADSPGLRAVWDEQNGNVFLREDIEILDFCKY